MRMLDQQVNLDLLFLKDLQHINQYHLDSFFFKLIVQSLSNYY